MRIMYDADNPYDIPRDARMVAGYVDGSRTTWKQEWWDRFPGAVKVRISAVGVRWDIADVFDVEPGCIWPPENVVPLIKQARKAGRNPTVYCNEMNHWQYIREMFRKLNMTEPPYWVANYNGRAAIPAGAVAKQYMHPPQTGKHYDLSSVADYWPGVDVKEEPMTPQEFKQLLAETQIDVRGVNEKGEEIVVKRESLLTILEWLGNEFNATRKAIPTKEEILAMRTNLVGSGQISIKVADQPL